MSSLGILVSMLKNDDKSDKNHKNTPEIPKLTNFDFTKGIFKPILPQIKIRTSKLIKTHRAEKKHFQKNDSIHLKEKTFMYGGK